MTRLFLSFSFVLAVAACSGSDKKTTEAPGGPVPAEGGEQAACAPTGCSNTVCAAVGEDVMTTCEWKDEYACYKEAVCERQPDGACGWTQSEALTACLASPPPAS